MAGVAVMVPDDEDTDRVAVDLLADAFARELHRRMFNQIWRWAGKYRTSDRNLGWEWSRIPEGMRALLDGGVGRVFVPVADCHGCRAASR